MSKRPLLACACLVSVLASAPADRARADAAAVQVVAPWLRISPEGLGELFFAVANHGVAERAILGAETADGMPSKPGAAIALPAHETVFDEPGSAAIRLAVGLPRPTPGDIVPLTLILDRGDRLPIEAIAGSYDGSPPEIFALAGKRIPLLAFGCDQLPEVSADVQAAIGAWILAYLHEPIDERAALSVLNDLEPGCDDHPEAILLDIVDMLSEEGE